MDREVSGGSRFGFKSVIGCVDNEICMAELIN